MNSILYYKSTYYTWDSVTHDFQFIASNCFPLSLPLSALDRIEMWKRPSLLCVCASIFYHLFHTFLCVAIFNRDETVFHIASFKRWFFHCLIKSSETKQFALHMIVSYIFFLCHVAMYYVHTKGEETSARLVGKVCSQLLTWPKLFGFIAFGNWKLR